MVDDSTKPLPPPPPSPEEEAQTALKRGQTRIIVGTILGLLALVVLIAVCSLASNGGTTPAPTAIPEAAATLSGEMTWADWVRLYEKEQPGNPANLYVDALISLNQGEITGEDVLDTAQATDSFTTFCALERAWVYSDVGEVGDPVDDVLLRIDFDRWGDEDQLCLFMEGLASPFGYDTPLASVQAGLAASATSDVLSDRILSQHLAMAALAEAKREEADAAFAMTWPEEVQWWEDKQGDDPTNLYLVALTSLNEGGITGEDVLKTVRASSSFTTFCALSVAWGHSEVGDYEKNAVLDVLAVRLVNGWPDRDAQDCIDDLDWSALTQ